MTQEIDREMQLDQAEIARRAHFRYIARGYEDGHDMEDWLEAERELREELEAKGTASDLAEAAFKQDGAQAGRN